MRSRSSTKLDYWSTAKEPWPSLLFILPFLFVYEIGTCVTFRAGGFRNGADLWFRQLGSELGFTVDWAFPLLAPILLLIWQIAARRPWKWNLETLGGMLAESLIFAMALIFIGQVIAAAFPGQVPPVQQIGSLPRAISFVGAGIYEEMLFRLAMIPLFAIALKLLLIPHRVAVFFALVGASLVFALAHYVDSLNVIAPGDLAQAIGVLLASPELWFSFTFRFLAGIVFSTLFLVRGFGIAVGSHILYDLAVGVVLADLH